MPANPYQPPRSEPVVATSSGDLFRRPKHWVIAISLFALTLGASSRLSRPYLNVNGLHWDALVSIVLLCVVSLGLLIRCYRARFIMATCYYQSGLISLWTSFVVGWCLAAGSVFAPLFQTCAMWWFGWAVIGLISFAIPHRVYATRIP
jgi:hypothetical protein